MIPATDIDIDTADRKRILELFDHTTAVINRKGKILKHNTGVYFHKMPKDPFTGMATIDHKIAEDKGFFKIDILNLGLYKDVKDNEHLTKLMEKEPLWELLDHKDFVDQLFHLNGHSELLKQLKPTSVEHLAATLAIIRPAKRHLQSQNWQTIMKDVWTKPEDDSYYFKKSHAIAYAHAVVVQMNLLCEDVVS